MGHDMTGKFIWIVDTLRKYGYLTREELDALWVKSPLSDGVSIPARTFYHYRRSIEKNFGIDIECDKLGRYYINSPVNNGQTAYTNLLLESYAVGSALRESSIPAMRVEVEDVPSSREFFPLMLEAISNSTKIVFTYSGFNRSRAEHDIEFLPCFLKRYKQRWYVIGIKVKGNSVRTYALDRIKEMRLTGEQFEMPEALRTEDLFGNIVGVTTSEAQVRTVRLQTTPTQAKYFRALPLHQSQTEIVHDHYSIFSYKLKLNYELVHEILGFGDSVKVLEPPELKAMVVKQLKDTLEQYGGAV